MRILMLVVLLVAAAPVASAEAGAGAEAAAQCERIAARRDVIGLSREEAIRRLEIPAGQRFTLAYTTGGRTTDYVAERLNIELNIFGRVSRVFCG